MEEGTRILTLRGKNVIEDELGIPVTACRNVTIPPRMGGIFHVDINATFDTNQVLTPPVREEDDKFMHILHIINVGSDKSWYIKKGDVLAFARPESDAVQYMKVLGPEREIKQNLQVRPRNWIPKSVNIAPIEVNETFTRMENTINGEDSLLTLIGLHTRRQKVKENSENSLKSSTTNPKGEEVTESVTNAKIDNTPKQGKN